MDQHVKDVLKDLGLEDKEIKVYLTLTSTGTLTALQISQLSRIDRTTTYDVLERLIDKGIVSSLVINSTKHFKALTSKELLIHYKEKYSSLEKILPEFAKIENQTKDPVRFELFQGKDGFKTLIRDLLDAKKDYKAIGIKKEYEEILSYFTQQSTLKVNEMNVKETAIVERKTKFIKTKKGSYRYLDNKLISPVTTLIYGQTVVFFIWTEPYFAIRIENKTFCKAQEEYFGLLWSIASTK